jgi:hypothetical protein
MKSLNFLQNEIISALTEVLGRSVRMQTLPRDSWEGFFQVMRRIAFLLIAVATVASVVPSTAAAEEKSIRPFHINEEQLVDLRRRIAATHWPDPETAWEEPELFAAELRAAFRSLRPAH